MTHTKQLLLVTFCDKTAGASFWTYNHNHRRTDGQIDVEVEIGSYIDILCFKIPKLTLSHCKSILVSG